MLGSTSIAVVKSDKNKPLGKPTSRWEENNKMDLRQIGQGRGRGWTKLIWFRIHTWGGLLWKR
jgi:hypothetical protein